MITRTGAMRMAVGVWAVSLFAWSPVRAEPPATAGDIPPKFVAPTEANDFVKREVTFQTSLHTGSLALDRRHYQVCGEFRVVIRCTASPGLGASGFQVVSSRSDQAASPSSSCTAQQIGTRPMAIPCSLSEARRQEV